MPYSSTTFFENIENQDIDVNLFRIKDNAPMTPTNLYVVPQFAILCV